MLRIEPQTRASMSASSTLDRRGLVFDSRGILYITCNGVRKYLPRHRLPAVNLSARQGKAINSRFQLGIPTLSEAERGNHWNHHSPDAFGISPRFVRRNDRINSFFKRLLSWQQLNSLPGPTPPLSTGCQKIFPKHPSYRFSLIIASRRATPAR